MLGSCAQQGDDGLPSQCGGDGSGICDTAPLPPLIKDKVLLKHMENLPEMVVFDLETTGLDLDCDIVQLSAVVKDQTFNQYILPFKPISWQASEVTSLTVKTGSLYLKGKKIESRGAKEAFQCFLNWLKPIAPVVLIAHNCYNFDAKRLLNSMAKHGLEAALCSVVSGFLDSLPLFKHIFPNMPNYKQETIVHAVLKEHYTAHDALQDVMSLQKVMNSLNLSTADLINYSFTYKSLKEMMEYTRKGKENANSLAPLVASKYLTGGTAETLGKAGFDLLILKSLHMKGGKDLLTEVFGRPSQSGQPRVRLGRSVINSISEYFSMECNY